MMNILRDISQALVDGDKNGTVKLVKKALSKGIGALEILNNGLIVGMDEVGALWNEGEIFIPEVLVSARAMNAASKVIESVLAKEGFEPIATAVIGTVKGDLHDIGKNLVGMMLKGKGIEIVDLGVDVSKEQYLEAVKKHNAQFVVCSSLITTTMTYMKDIIQYFNEQGMKGKVVIACGGAPVTEAYTKEIGADVYTDDAVQLSNVFLKMVKG